MVTQAPDKSVRCWGGLPYGFQVQVDFRRVVDGGVIHLLGESPAFLPVPAEDAREMIDADGRVHVVDARTAEFARWLLDVQAAHPRPMFGPAPSAVTVVIPVKDNQSGVDRVVSALYGVARVIVVDRGSAAPITATGAEVIRIHSDCSHSTACNLGLSRAETDYVAFLDSDVVPERDWLDKLLPHFSDARVTLVAPRITPALVTGDRASCHGEPHSPLDMGRREAAVIAGTSLSCVPDSAIIVRRNAFNRIGGFDTALLAGADVDLCWRMAASGYVMRYEPIAVVTHHRRYGLLETLSRKHGEGTGAAVLADRHRRSAAPLFLTRPLAALCLALLSGTVGGAAAAIAMMAIIAIRLSRRLSETPDAARIAARLTVRSTGAGMLRVASAICCSYWPLSLLLALVSHRFRVVLLAVALGEGVVEWVRDEAINPEPLPRLGVILFVAYKRLGDLAYGAGLWRGVIVGRSPVGLCPAMGAIAPIWPDDLSGAAH